MTSVCIRKPAFSDWVGSISFITSIAFGACLAASLQLASAESLFGVKLKGISVDLERGDTPFRAALSLKNDSTDVVVSVDPNAEENAGFLNDNGSRRNTGSDADLNAEKRSNERPASQVLGKARSGIQHILYMAVRRWISFIARIPKACLCFARYFFYLSGNRKRTVEDLSKSREVAAFLFGLSTAGFAASFILSLELQLVLSDDRVVRISERREAPVFSMIEGGTYLTLILEAMAVGTMAEGLKLIQPTIGWMLQVSMLT